uniref:Lipoprotein n=1 Tax=viral metagenome TaxID=1070528 RepID=A0A6C0ENX3_9ZZZZ
MKKELFLLFIFSLLLVGCGRTPPPVPEQKCVNYKMAGVELYLSPTDLDEMCEDTRQKTIEMINISPYNTTAGCLEKLNGHIKVECVEWEVTHNEEPQ